MGRFIEVIVFSMMALVVHVVGFYSMPTEGVQAGGVGGENAVSIIAASQQVETMVEAWDQPPVMAPPPNQLVALSTSEEAPALTAPNSTVAIVNIPSMEAPELPAQEAPAALDTNSTKPPEKPEIKKLPEHKEPLEEQVLKIENVGKETPPEPQKPVEEKQLKPEEVIVRKLIKDNIRPPLRQPIKPSAPKKDVQIVRINQRSSAGSDGQLSVGKGKSAFAGTGNAKVSTGASAKQLASIKAVWGARIRRRIERVKKYPRGVRKNGRAVVILVVSRSGNLMNYRLGRSSGNGKLDAAALQAANKSGRLPAAPKELKGASYKFTVPIVFKR